uniref:Small ribosomal subunit protein uS19m n=1 Tax=Tetraselmis sp. CCMP 881 TaxID=1812852 RepID=A0A650AR84_9CHLO|nr:ribosomal protein S19 [Tetraselmis sp. CCMP 881]
MTRAIWKGPFLDPSFFRKRKNDFNIKEKIYSRRSAISPQFIGREVQVYNGHKWIEFKIKEEMVGHKFGEFSFTRKKTIHKKKGK